MANKKRKKGGKKRPGPARPAGGQPRAGAAQARPAEAASAPPSVAEPAQDKRSAARERREAAARRRERRQRMRRIRNYSILGLVLVLLLGALGFWFLDRRREAQAFSRIASAAGCTDVRKTSDSGSQQHLEEGATTTYEDSPPTHGPHAGNVLSAGFYDTPLVTDTTTTGSTLYEAVHSLEHGYVIAWFKDLTPDEQAELTEVVEGQRKVIAAPWPELEGGKMALTAWARTMTCEEADPKVVTAFADRFRESTAPEPNGP